MVHNESVARFFHHQLTNTVSAIAGEAIKPSYVYLASYLSGAELKKHTDREQCEFSITLCLDFSPEPQLATSWPIRLDTPEGTVTVYQALGDGLVYRGMKVPHYRNVLADEAHLDVHFFPLRAGGFFGAAGLRPVFRASQLSATASPKLGKERKRPGSSYRRSVNHRELQLRELCQPRLRWSQAAIPARRVFLPVTRLTLYTFVGIWSGRYAIK